MKLKETTGRREFTLTLNEAEAYLIMRGMGEQRGDSKTVSNLYDDLDNMDLKPTNVVVEFTDKGPWVWGTAISRQKAIDVGMKI